MESINIEKSPKINKEKRAYLGRPPIEDAEFLQIVENYKKRRELSYICLKKGVDCECEYCKYNAGYASKDKHYRMRVVTKTIYKPKSRPSGLKDTARSIKKDTK